mgnify:CR=1 FL=1
MKKVILIALGATLLAGCTAREQQLAAAGVVGAPAGAIVASEVSRPQPMYVEERPRLVVPADRTYLPPPRYIPQRQCYRVWDRTPYGMVERTVCR